MVEMYQAGRIMGGLFFFLLPQNLYERRKWADIENAGEGGGDERWW